MNILFINIFFVGFMVSEIPRVSVFGHCPYSVTFPYIVRQYDIHTRLELLIYYHHLHLYTRTHTHTHIYIYIYITSCVAQLAKASYTQAVGRTLEPRPDH